MTSVWDCGDWPISERNTFIITIVMINHTETSSRDAVPSVLVLAYAVPPLQVPMSPVAARLIAGLQQAGLAVDVICAHPDASSFSLPHDDSLCDYLISHCRGLMRLRSDSSLQRVLTHHRPFLRHFPDVMAGLQGIAFRAVMAAKPASYSAVLTVSPFHSVNPVMVRVKRACPGVRWIAHFGDPWASNPLEERPLARLWNSWRESQTVRAATYVTHTSHHALDTVLRTYPFLSRDRTRVIPHAFDPGLYPSRPKQRNDQLTVRYLGTLFGRRSPTPLFKALGRLINRRPDLRDVLRVELIGPMDRHLSAWEAFDDLPRGMVLHRHAVDYVESLKLMYDADLLVVIEADVEATPFVPSKLMDYMGADTPMIGLAPTGGCREILDRLGCLTANPLDVEAIANVLEAGIDRIIQGGTVPWCRDDVRRSYDLTGSTEAFVSLIEEPIPQ